MMDAHTRFNPFPGLRSFEADEDHLFFGREKQITELLARLRRTRFLSVVGTSGSGKSSLIRAGLVPSLYSGFMTKAGSGWRVAVFRPGEDPIGNLAAALNAPEVLGEAGEPADTSRAILETTLRSSSLGLADCARHARIPAHENVLVVVDQFEELFRFKDSRKIKNSRDEAVAFVKLLLEATRHEEVPVYIVLTMRSDFIGDCMEFPGLPEAVNEGQYLVPRMSREQLRAAITGPVAMGGREITPRLVLRLQNEVGDNPDQLPVLQHSLMRIWDHWEQHHADRQPLDLQHYEAIGTMKEALSRHAEEAYQELTTDRSKEIAENLFKALTDKSSDIRGVRRPVQVKEVCALTGADETEVIEVIERFRQPGRTFVMPPAGIPLHGDSIIDLSHETLMRVWGRLIQWAEEERRSAESYVRLSRAAAWHEEGTAGLWRDPELQLALQWREQNRPTAAWAQRYDPAFDRAMLFLDSSKRKRMFQRAGRFTMILGIILGLGIFAREQQWNAEKQRQLTEISLSRKLASQASDRLQEQLDLALLLSVEALRTPTVEARDSALSALQATPDLAELLHSDILTPGQSGWVTSLAFSQDGRWLAAGVGRGGFRLWNMTQSPPAARELDEQSFYVYSVAFSPDGRWLALGSKDHSIVLWDVQRGKAVDPPLKTDRKWSNNVVSLAFSRDGKILASASSDGSVLLWDIAARDLAALPLTGSAYRGKDAFDVAFSPDGRWLAAASMDSMRLWDLTKGEPTLVPLLGSGVRRLAHSGGVDFSPDRKILAFGGGMLTLLDVTEDRTGTSLVGQARPLSALKFFPDGEQLVTAGTSGIRLWDVGARRPTGPPLQGHPKGALSVAISPDGKTVASGGRDGKIIVWELTTEALRTHACRGAGRNLSHSEWIQYLGAEPYNKTCNDLPVHPSFVEAGEEMGKAGNIEKAVVIFQRAVALKIEPKLALPPLAYAQRLAAPVMISWAVEQAKRGDVDSAAENFRLANEFDPQIEKSVSRFGWRAHYVCWYSSLWGHPEKVMDTCDRSLQSLPGHGAFHRARALARAITGDYPGAVDDLERALKSGWFGKPEDRALMEGWIKELRAARNPIDEATLEKIRATITDK